MTAFFAHIHAQISTKHIMDQACTESDEDSDFNFATYHDNSDEEKYSFLLRIYTCLEGSVKYGGSKQGRWQNCRRQHEDGH